MSTEDKYMDPPCIMQAHTCKHGPRCRGWEINDYEDGLVEIARPHECELFESDPQILSHMQFCTGCRNNIGDRLVQIWMEASTTSMRLAWPKSKAFTSKTLYYNWFRMQAERPYKEREGWADEP